VKKTRTREELAGDVFTPHGAANVPKGKRVAFYMRVSTEEQTTKNQHPELARMAAMRKLGVVREYRETMSAAKSRPTFDRMMADSRAGVFDVLIVWALDRFGRSMLGNLQAIIQLDKLGIVTMSARESWLELDGPARQLLIGVFSWVAEQERKRLSERTIAGMDRARAAGRVVGRPRAHIPIVVARALLTDHSRAVVARKLGTSTASLDRALARAEPSSKGASEPKPSK
jgi:putative DNA-invertase from lambdoid prophage Rac